VTKEEAKAEEGKVGMERKEVRRKQRCSTRASLELASAKGVGRK